MPDTVSTALRHPWNIGFDWVAPPGSGGVLGAVQVEQFDDRGYVVIPDLLDVDPVRELVSELDEFERRNDAEIAAEHGGRRKISENGAITFTTHLVTQSSSLRALSRHRELLGIAANLVGDDVDLYWDQAVYKKPENQRRFPWHQDNGYTFVEPQQYLTFWIALTDATIENGCPVVAPGFHRLGTLAHRYVDPLGWECLTDPDRATVTKIAAGGAVVFSSLTPHLTGANMTDGVRKAYILQYAPAGAEVLRGDPTAGPPTHRDRCDAPDWSYPVLRGGMPTRGLHNEPPSA